jgi:hypothetical protein
MELLVYKNKTDGEIKYSFDLTPKELEYLKEEISETIRLEVGKSVNQLLSESIHSPIEKYLMDFGTSEKVFEAIFGAIADYGIVIE